MLKFHKLHIIVVSLEDTDVRTDTLTIYLKASLGFLREDSLFTEVFYKKGEVFTRKDVSRMLIINEPPGFLEFLYKILTQRLIKEISEVFWLYLPSKGWTSLSLTWTGRGVKYYNLEELNNNIDNQFNMFERERKDNPLFELLKYIGETQYDGI